MFSNPGWLSRTNSYVSLSSCLISKCVSVAATWAAAGSSPCSLSSKDPIVRINVLLAWRGTSSSSKNETVFWSCSRSVAIPEEFIINPPLNKSDTESEQKRLMKMSTRKLLSWYLSTPVIVIASCAGVFVLTGPTVSLLLLFFLLLGELSLDQTLDGRLPCPLPAPVVAHVSVNRIGNQIESQSISI